MSTAQTLRIESTNSEATERIAEKIGRNLRGGEVIELSSDLGGGKTTFVRGLARGAGSHDRVASPTFTISKVYQTPKLAIHHFDFYRLPEAGMVGYELEDILGDPAAVIVVEWGAVIEHALPDDRICIELQRTGDDTRKLILVAPPQLAYLVEGLS